MTAKNFITSESVLLISGAASADHAWSVEGISDGAGRVSIQIDLGARPDSYIFSWSGEVLFQATPTQYNLLEFYKAGAPDDDSTQIDGDVGASDAALGDVDQVLNLDPIGSIIVEEADTSKMVGSGEFEHKDRYLSLVALNNAGSAVNATDTNFVFKLTRRAKQAQDT